MRIVISQRLLIKGFLNFDYTDKLFGQFLREVSKGITDGRIRHQDSKRE